MPLPSTSSHGHDPSHGHGHSHDHGHGHSHSAAGLTRRHLTLAIGFTLAFVVAEALAGLHARSLALLSDAGHNFADALALGLSWYAVTIAMRPADSRRTFGYHRVGILAALVNAVALVLIALGIFWEAWGRFRDPVAVASGPMIGMALGAILLNGAITMVLHGRAREDLNVRGAYMHMLGDAISALGVVIAGVIIQFTGSTVADPLISMVIGAVILWSSWGVLTEAVAILMEAAPAHIDMTALERALDEVPGVESAHDLHVWTVASGLLACSCHILICDQTVGSGQQVLRSVSEMLEHRFGITHSTLQMEVEECDPNTVYCTMRQQASTPCNTSHAPHASPS